MVSFSRCAGAVVMALAAMAGCTASPLVRHVDAKAYKAAEIYTADSFKYGRYEMRMQVAKGSGILSTFFMYKSGSEASGAYWEEIDIEVFGKDNAAAWQSNIIQGTVRPTLKTEETNALLYSLGDGYHTYVLEWTPSYVAWFVDGIERRRLTDTDPVNGHFVTGLTGQQSMRFNIWPADIPSWVGTFNANVLPVYQFVNYVEYKPYVAANNSFGWGWRDDFNTFDTSRWSKASWTFGENLADFDPNNVVVRNGTLILALTAEGQTGFTGTPPVDDGSVRGPTVLIEAESFNEVGGTVNVNGGVVGYIDDGEWMKYTNIYIPATGKYVVKYRVASAYSTARLTLDQNGNSLGHMNVPNTGAWGTYTTIEQTIDFTIGVQNLAIFADKGGFNIDWFSLTKI